MSDIHLTVGSKQPPKVESKLRLYSMKYCPYAQRARLVLLAKDIPHDIVNINLIDKPEWYFTIHPEGKVPALDTGSRIVVESLDIAEYLDETYPEKPLYKPEWKAIDKELINKISPLTTTFAKCVFGMEQKTPEEWLKEFLPLLQVFDDELSKRGTAFFGGTEPGMVDYMLWPWGERAGTIALALNGSKLPFTNNQLITIRKWKHSMSQHPICSQIYNGPEKFWKVVQFKLKHLKPDYDNV